MTPEPVVAGNGSEPVSHQHPRAADTRRASSAGGSSRHFGEASLKVGEQALEQLERQGVVRKLDFVGRRTRRTSAGRPSGRCRLTAAAMANYLAIAAVAKTILRLIEEQCPRERVQRRAQLRPLQQSRLQHRRHHRRLLADAVPRDREHRAAQPAAAAAARRREERPSLPVDLSLHAHALGHRGRAAAAPAGMGDALPRRQHGAAGVGLNQSLSRRERRSSTPTRRSRSTATRRPSPTTWGCGTSSRRNGRPRSPTARGMVKIESDIDARRGPLVRTRDLRVGTEQLEACA